jgi:DNA-binding response OmpR family regulator
MRVLIADGDPESLRLLRRTLEKLRHEVAVARDGAQALALYVEQPFPLVIADWQIPQLSGIALCKAIRQSAGDRLSYVVIATTLADDENVLDGFHAGADDYLVKPFCPEQLEARIVAAERACNLIGANTGMTMRKLLEMCQTHEGKGGHALRDGMGAVASRYETRRAYSKARTFLRRQIVLDRDRARSGSPRVEVARLVRELELLHGLEEDAL